MSANQSPTRAECQAILHDRSKVQDFDAEYLKRFASAHIALLDENAELRRRLGVVLAVGQDELNQDGWDGYELAKAAEALAEALGSARPYVYITDHAARQDTLIEIDAALAQYKALGRDKCADSERSK